MLATIPCITTHRRRYCVITVLVIRFIDHTHLIARVNILIISFLASQLQMKHTITQNQVSCKRMCAVTSNYHCCLDHKRNRYHELLRTLFLDSWWHHQMETFSTLLAICAGNSPVTGEFPARRPVTQRFDVFFDLHLNKRRLSKQSRGWWFEKPSCPLWRHCNVPIECHQHDCVAWLMSSSTS